MLSSVNFKVAVVIVTYNGESWIKPCLSSIYNGNYPAQVIVVDNASKDATTTLIQTEFPQAILLKNEENLGFGQANNLGIAYALHTGADYIFLLNQDTTVRYNTIQTLVEGFSLHPEFDLLSPAHYNSTATRFDFGFERYVLQEYTKEEVKKWYSPMPGSCFRVSFVNAAAWMVKASVFEKIGGFSPLFFHYGEDREYAKRMEFHDLKTGIIPAAEILHYRDNRNNDTAAWTYSKRLKYYYIGYIFRLSDVNNTFINRFFFSVYWLIKDCISLFFRGVLSAPFMFFHVLANVISSLTEITGHRKQVKKPLPYLFLTRFMKF